MKPFNLEEALSGKPVKLRDGSVAYVVGCVPDVVSTAYPLRGVVVERNEFGNLVVDTNNSWTIEGRSNINIAEHPLDIVGMTVESPIYIQDSFAGKYVRLRNGAKGYILGILPSQFDTLNEKSVLGISIEDYKGKERPSGQFAWTRQGRVKSLEDEQHPFDIIGLWPE